MINSNITVRKMKAFFILSVIFAGLLCQDAQAQTVRDELGKHLSYSHGAVVSPISKNGDPLAYYDIDPKSPTGVTPKSRHKSLVKAIQKRGKVRCGTNLQTKVYAYKEDNGWYGIDADFCKAFALATLGSADKIEMINIEQPEIVTALNSGRIDVMLSGSSMTARLEMYSGLERAGILYYEPQQLMFYDADGSKDSDFVNKKVCVLQDSSYFNNFDVFNLENNLKSNYLKLPSLRLLREALMLKRCDIATGGATFLNGMKEAVLSEHMTIFGEAIAYMPVYALVKRDNADFVQSVRWIINALQLAEQYGIEAKNIKFFEAHNNPEIRNMMGDDYDMWLRLGLLANWLKDAIPLLGNYGEIYERNLGEDSDYQIPRGAGRLAKDGGAISPVTFM